MALSISGASWFQGSGVSFMASREAAVCSRFWRRISERT